MRVSGEVAATLGVCREGAMARAGLEHPDLSAVVGAGTPETADRSASVPDHVDGVLEVNPAGLGEGGGHRDVAWIRRGPDARYVLRGQDPGPRGEDVVDVTVAVSSRCR